ncbi:C-3 sterol dehydrogenase [Rhizophagus irregularis]|uniref:C-3 sterol dehydrogenase n=1 Tax=Rhizophagus irregularis TaxID=588596 RepID=A0A2N1NNH1_9GLOM|nr:C-3 sterol dehydrogenase [Rhizophagus irregularis]
MVENYLIIGGDGFVGRWVVEMLIKRGETSITVFDIVQRYFDKEIKHYQGDLSNYDDISDCIEKENITAIIHTASPPHDGKSEGLFWEVNVEGTKNVIEACVKFGVKKLVYTSSSSVVYDGYSELINTDETAPYPEKHMNVYNETKAAGEKLVLEANGRNGLLTCALRPCGIFGPNDRQAIPGFIKVMEQGQTKFQIGNNENFVDWTYVENCAYAHILAVDKLSVENQTAGEAYFITNGTPVPFWDLCRLIWAQFNHYPPYILKFPSSFGFVIASLAELASYITGKEPGFTRFRVRFATTNRYFNINKARNRLGYEPLVDLEEGVKRACQPVLNSLNKY